MALYPALSYLTECSPCCFRRCHQVPLTSTSSVCPEQCWNVFSPRNAQMSQSKSGRCRVTCVRLCNYVTPGLLQRAGLNSRLLDLIMTLRALSTMQSCTLLSECEWKLIAALLDDITDRMYA